MGTPCELRPDGGHVLDLASSWVSHLPLDHTYHVIGHDLNADEFIANLRLHRWFVRKLDHDATLPSADRLFDAAL